MNYDFKKLKSQIKRIKFIYLLIKYFSSKYKDINLRVRNYEEIFDTYYKTNYWLSTESNSGIGSTIDQTQFLVRDLPVVFAKYKIKTILDIPSGDFNWMQKVDFSGVNYIGADIVSDIVSYNKKKYSAKNIKFTRIDILKDKLPTVDLIFCRDCLVHFSNNSIFQALENICDSKSKYLLTTNFPSTSKNKDISTGNWRKINLSSKPFGLPKPLFNILEGCSEEDYLYNDKSLALWDIQSIKARL